jgi:hypothetical protein
MCAIASSRGSVPEIAKKHVCMTVLMRVPMPALLGQCVGVDGEEAELLVDDSLLHLARQVVPYLVGREWGVQQERRARCRVFEHVDLVDELELMAGDEPGAIHEIRRSDGARARSQMRNGDRARLLRVVDEVALGEEVCFLADDLDGVLVGADGAVGAEAVEHDADDVLASVRNDGSHGSTCASRRR